MNTKQEKNPKAIRKTTCFRCDGVAVLPCPYCGSKRKDCRVCRGDVLTCKICNGRGYLEEKEIDLDPMEADINKC